LSAASAGVADDNDGMKLTMPLNRINPDGSKSLRILASIMAVGMVSWVAGATTSFLPDGGEYLPTGPMAGDQTAPAIAFSTDGGFLVWQDSAGNGDGAGIRARRIGKTLSGSLPAFWVNSNSTFINEAPDVALLADGGAVFAWQAGPLGRPGIYARFMRPMTTTSPSFVASDVEIVAGGSTQNQTPKLARLTDGSVVVAWANVGQDGDLSGILVQKLTATGQKTGTPFVANITTEGNQRNPAITATTDGGFTVAWVGENQRFDFRRTSTPASLVHPASRFQGRFASTPVPISVPRRTLRLCQPAASLPLGRNSTLRIWQTDGTSWLGPMTCPESLRECRNGSTPTVTPIKPTPASRWLVTLCSPPGLV